MNVKKKTTGFVPIIITLDTEQELCDFKVILEKSVHITLSDYLGNLGVSESVKKRIIDFEAEIFAAVEKM